ncbi:MAG: protein-tyrosine-phosphatase [Deltaproteobacteria bacterium]|nr:protein-tyrosine-phosphatase [Deltaproteobacteria bacterium]MBW2211386.1 protein-tyrosine-phosphatase [Deltaproteobacteria bacterium]MBW2627685.1 protein-tyrosine-phosphatase [Deltaproteobacteria bacterium]MBW2685748.1 protein-tyrosine-phosphatase [Deltaproteobacteria bacterium]
MGLVPQHAVEEKRSLAGSSEVRKRRMHPKLAEYIDRAGWEINAIPEDRKRLLEEVAAFVSSARQAGNSAELTFICTHNSRRSHMGQLWAAAAAAHCGIDGVRTYSGGTEATAFNPRAVAAMEKAGFVIDKSGGDNPRYLASFDEGGPVIECFSKTYDDPVNPTEDFAAIMTCSEADEACPVVLGAALRAPIWYEDPKVVDGTPKEAAAYDERCLQIATEMLYLFSRVT